MALGGMRLLVEHRNLAEAVEMLPGDALRIDDPVFLTPGIGAFRSDIDTCCALQGCVTGSVWRWKKCGGPRTPVLQRVAVAG
jgi:hypothetical protein